jgi:protoheme IX farnesyltransferase
VKGAAEYVQQPGSQIRTLVVDLVTLMKPELTGLSVLTTLCGYYLGLRGPLNVNEFLFLALATTFVGGGIGALNQFVERRFDGLMRRTERRPLPDGRMTPELALVFGTVMTIGGVVLIAYLFNALTLVLALLIVVSYLFIYTPLKRITPLSTVIGGLPGALPPVMGWTAATGRLSASAIVLFAILFFWQMPHFYSLAWMYKRDYARAGYRMLSVIDEHGRKTSIQSFVFTLALFLSSLLLAGIGTVGPVYLAGAILLGSLFLLHAYVFLKTSNISPTPAIKLNQSSRALFFASLWYLPGLMLLMVLDKTT